MVALKFLERREGRYYNTPSTDLFLDKRKPSYIGGVLEMANHRLYPFWGNLNLNMLIETNHGCDCAGWMKEAGFRETRLEHLVGPDSMVIGIK